MLGETSDIGTDVEINNGRRSDRCRNKKMLGETSNIGTDDRCGVLRRYLRLVLLLAGVINDCLYFGSKISDQVVLIIWTKFKKPWLQLIRSPFRLR